MFEASEASKPRLQFFWRGQKLKRKARIFIFIFILDEVDFLFFFRRHSDEVVKLKCVKIFSSKELGFTLTLKHALCG